MLIKAQEYFNKRKKELKVLLARYEEFKNKKEPVEAWNTLVEALNHANETLTVIQENIDREEEQVKSQERKNNDTTRMIVSPKSKRIH